ncbi:MAG: hypothetical protein C4527_11795 [Candidatus Omnitrophota bacterium]|jgi:putative ABC transport system permease protein|nr:MAG: hypothetical protein C4527_11795 [Candidatus Omnitrophota bacterium]
MELWIGAVNLGFLYAFMTMGVFITFRIKNFPDITVDGSFTSGAAVAAVLIVAGWNPVIALIAAFFIGALAGSATALIHTRFKINGLLAGILVMTGLYSVNLHIMKRSNIPLLNQTTLITFIENRNPGFPEEIWVALCLCGIMALFWLVVSLFFKTDLGVAMRATGNNSTMAAASGVNVNRMIIFGVALANGFVGVSGGLVAQYQGFADIQMGIGTIVIGLAAVIIGESILPLRSMYAKVLCVIIGSVVFRFMIAFALYVGMDPMDLKLLTAIFVLLTLIVSTKVAGGEGKKREWLNRLRPLLCNWKFQTGAAVVILFILIGIIVGRKDESVKPTADGKIYKIGVVQISDHGLLNITRDSFIEEMNKIGYMQGVNCDIRLENANGDQPTVNTILDKFLYDNVDIVVTISTPCTQPAIKKIKDRPVVFATVANPFIIDAGKSDTDHLENVTGVYGAVPMSKTLDLVRDIFPGKIKIGAIWDPSHTNSVYNVEQLKEAAEADPDVTFLGVNISNSSEVYQAALSLVNKGLDIFVLAPDNIVYSAFESVVKAARPKKIPIFTSDVERLADGALAALGYDYTSSGQQTAHVVDRIIKGANPKDIPFEQYKKLTIGFNLETARELDVAIPPATLAKATLLHGQKKAKIGIVQFAMEPNVTLCINGILKALEEKGYKDKENLDIIYRNAQADFSMINSIMQDFIRQAVDIIVPLSTPCVQSAVQFAGKSKDTKVIFTYIYDPYKIGAAESPEKHLPTMTGISCFPPIEKMLDLIKEMFPDRKKIGMVWNSSEANSEAVLIKARTHAKQIGLEIVEVTVTNPTEVLEASRSLILKGAQVFLNGGDNTLNVSFDSFVKAADSNSIPVFSVDSELVEQGALVALGPNYYQTGYDGGVYLARVLKGEDPATLPILQTKETLFIINMDLARKYNFSINEAIVKRADKVIDSTKNAVAITPIDDRQRKLVIFRFSDNPLLVETERGILNELEESGITKKYNITIEFKNSQNDFTMAQSVAQDIVRLNYDYVVTISTPALQVTAQFNKKIPHVFGAVTDPYRMGVAKNENEHQANITGVATFQPVETTIKVMRELFPQARRIGIVWNPAEACSEACTYKARNAAKQYNFELVEVSVTSTSEVMDAVNAVINRGVDLFLTSGDNTVILALKSIAQVLIKKQIPYFTNDPTDVEIGAFVSIGADYFEVGQETARMAIRVINGEDPKTVPIHNFVPEKMSVNKGLADQYGIPLPEEFLQRAAKVKE